jgi:cation-transporting ATPase E
MLPRAQTVVICFLTVCGLLLVMFVEPPSRFWAGSDEPDGDRRPTWLAIVLLLGLLAIALVPTLSGLFDLRPVKPQDAAIIAAAVAVWVFMVRWAWRRHLLERFWGTDPTR